MSFSIQHIFIQAHRAGLRENKIEVLESLRKPERLHAVRFSGNWTGTIIEASVCDVGDSVLNDRIEHIPCSLAKRFISGDSVKNED